MGVHEYGLFVSEGIAVVVSFSDPCHVYWYIGILGCKLVMEQTYMYGNLCICRHDMLITVHREI